VITESVDGANFAARLSQWMMHPATGIPMLLALLFGMYKVLGEFVAGTVVGVTEEALMQGYWEPFVRGTLTRFTTESSAIYTFFAGDFGVITMTPTYLIGVILPLVTGFYLLLSVLEDSGYLPRIAALADRLLTSMGMNGRAVIPLILGLGCVTMGTLTTRILGSKRERFIATALMAIAVPCSAQIAVIAALMATVSPPYAAGYFLVLIAVFVAIGTALGRLVPGESTELLIDLPSLRVPRLDNVLRKSFVKVWHFMKEVTVFFLAGAAFISVLELTGGLTAIQRLATPLTVGWLNLPADASTAFVMGFVRRDFGAAGFFTMDLTAAQLLVGMITITLFVPCIASVMVIMKERGWKYLTGLFAASVGAAFLIGGLVAKVLEVL
jgi:ferrous iron transport protein B